MQNAKYYIFDLDGTLVDSMHVWAKAMLNILDKEGVPYPDGFIIKIATMGGKACAEYFQNELKINLSVPEIYQLNQNYCAPRYRDEIQLKDGVKNYLEKLKKQGCSLNVLTASPHANLDPCLKRNGVYDLFDNLWSTDDFNLQKTQVEIYQKVLSILNATPSQTVFFDDNLNALKTAKDAGLYTVGVYDFSSGDFTEQIKSTADKYVSSFTELL